MQGQQLFESVSGGRTGRSFRITANRSVAKPSPPSLVHSDTRLSVRSTENTQGQSNHGQSVSIQGREDDFQVDSHIPATRPGQESEPITGRTELLRWVAYMLGILLFVGGITITLF